MNASAPGMLVSAWWTRSVVAMTVAWVVTTAACAPAPAAAPVATPRAVAIVPIDTKVGWILRLEQERTLRVVVPGSAATPVAPAVPPTPADPTAVLFIPATSADLAALSRDPEAAVRQRATLALGRVGLPEGRALVMARLLDPDESVRETAAFALGLLGGSEGTPALVERLQVEPSARVRSRVIDALGLIGDKSAAAPIVAAAAGCAALMAPIAPDDSSRQAPEVDLCRLALLALVRLGDRDALRSVALDAQGRPAARWWPVAYALQRGGAPDADALLALVSTDGVYTPAFALRALATLQDARVVPLAAAITESNVDLKLRVAALRALAPFATPAAPIAMRLLAAADTPASLRLEAVPLAGGPQAFELLVDLFAHPWNALRIAAMRRAAAIDAEGFLVVASSFGDDPDWSVRAALADLVSGLQVPADRVMGWVTAAAADRDVRVRAAALSAMSRLNVPDVDARLSSALEAPDYALRAAAARLIGQRRPAGGAARLAAAYTRGDSDATDEARSAALAAIARYGGDEAVAVLRQALNDREWPVRLQAARLLQGLGEAGATAVRPAPIRQPAGFFGSESLLRPPFSPHAFIETAHGTIEIELNVIEAAVTTQTFMELARAGFYNGIRVHRLIPHFVIQAGDPRGDGSGGPGFTQRDELSALPFVRGTVGMALSGPDTGGSQFFIALSPQPHLDGRYTVFGQVVAGDEVLDRVALSDVIERIRIWDGVVLR